MKRPLFERTPTAYSDEWFDSYQPNSSYYLPDMLRKRLLESGQRTSGQNRAGTYAHQIFNRLIIDLSYNSSRLEGNTYLLLDTERLLLHGDSAEGKLAEERAMGFDEVRIRHRQERRAVIREIILQKRVGEETRLFVDAEATRLIPAAARDDFIEDILEDLKQMDESRLAGLEVTPEQLKTWREKV